MVSEDGTAEYPIVSGVPILIDERVSPFRIADYPSTFDRTAVSADGHRGLISLDRWLPSLSHNVGTRQNFARLSQLLREKRRGRRPRVLVVGGASAGVGFDVLANDPEIDCIDVDIALGPRTQVVCDVHDLPFADGAFDGVVAQAVLEHVLDPARVVSEMHRVLTDEGLVYSEIPFMYPGHGGAYDLTRYTLLGHRRLYRHFDEIQSGIQGGPGTSLGLSMWYFLRALARGRLGRVLAAGFARVFFFWLKYVDRWLVERAAAIDVASGTYFLGRKRERAVSDREVLASYRGGTGSQLPMPESSHPVMP